jgi:integrase
VGLPLERMKFHLPYIREDRDRHGNWRIYVRRNGRSIRIDAKRDTPEFLEAYQAALSGLEHTPCGARCGAKPNTLRWLVEKYYGSLEFKQELSDRTRYVRHGILDALVQKHGDKPFVIKPRHVRKLRDAKADTPEAANALVKALRQLFKWAVQGEYLDSNPAKDVGYIKTGSQGFHSWTIEEVRQYEAHHPVGTRARLALALLLYTTQRRSDIVRLGQKMVHDGWLKFTQVKNAKRKPVSLEIPILPELQRIIDATTPLGKDTYLVTEFGRPFTADGFGNRFRKWCDEAKLPHCSAHGLRKAGAARLAELGASDREIMAITGHQTAKEVDRYTKGARQKRLAANAMEKWEQGQNE